MCWAFVTSVAEAVVSLQGFHVSLMQNLPIVILSTATPPGDAYSWDDSSLEKFCHYCVLGGYGIGSNESSSVGGSFRTCLSVEEGFKNVVVGSTHKGSRRYATDGSVW